MILAATRNPGKLHEIAQALAPWTLESLSDAGLAGDVEETGASYRDNARLKALHWSRLAPGRLVLADDSGLEVDALDGRPGPLSARYGGAGLDDQERTGRLLQELRGTPPERRTARFRCALCLAVDGRFALETEGVSEGRILEAPRGAGGFGYDPVFFSPELGAAFSEVSRERKASVSHRGRALRALREAVERAGGPRALARGVRL